MRETSLDVNANPEEKEEGSPAEKNCGDGGDGELLEDVARVLSGSDLDVTFIES